MVWVAFCVVVVGSYVLWGERAVRLAGRCARVRSFPFVLRVLCSHVRRRAPRAAPGLGFFSAPPRGSPAYSYRRRSPKEAGFRLKLTGFTSQSAEARPWPARAPVVAATHAHHV